MCTQSHTTRNRSCFVFVEPCSVLSRRRKRESLGEEEQTWNWVSGSPGQWAIWVIFHVRVTGSSFWPGVRSEFFRFSKKCPKCKTYIWNAEMTKVIVRCLLLDWNHWMSVDAMNFYFYLWLLKNYLAWEHFFVTSMTSLLDIYVHYKTGPTGQLGLRVAGFPGHWVAGSQIVTQFHIWYKHVAIHKTEST